jgi:hypothetical protein
MATERWMEGGQLRKAAVQEKRKAVVQGKLLF